MNAPRLHTPRLRLVAQTAELARAEIGDPAGFVRLLDADVPAGWPPPLNDQDSRTWALHALEANPDAVGWVLWYLLKAEGSRPPAIGVAGFKGPPVDGVCEVGYSVMPDQQRQGYATEAVQALLHRAFGFPEVSTVLAHTFPELLPSIGVMKKCGFTLDGPGEEAGTVRYGLTRASFFSHPSDGPG